MDKIKELRQLIKENIGMPDGKVALLPSGFQRIGEIILLKFQPGLEEYEKKIAILLAEKFHVKTVCKITGVSGELRKPKVKLLFGKGTETIHREHGIQYKLDVSKIMFSKGNLTERNRLTGQIKSGEVIVDMFAGIGYFSLGLSKHTQAKKIYSVEKNKVSYKYLLENMKLNKIANIKPIYGDCTKVKIPEKADRVLMGYLPKTYLFLPAAFGFLKEKGIIHYHDTFSKKELWKKPKSLLKNAAAKAGYSVNILNKKIVKDYAPNVFHVVVDVEAVKI